jgi:hypothetical protein
MDFIAHDFWSVAYVVLLTIAGYATIKGRNTDERRILHILILNWLCVRSLVTWFEQDPVLWSVLDVASIVALLVYGRTFASGVCALFHFASLQIDILHHFGAVSIETALALWDLLAFIVLLIMAGAANDFWTGKRLRFTDLWWNRSPAAHSVLVVRRNTSQSPDVDNPKN